MQGVSARDSAIKALKPREREFEVSVREHRGLIVVVYPSGARSYTLRYRQDGILKRIRLDASTLPAARAEWQLHREAIQSGKDPSEAVRLSRVEKRLERDAHRKELTVEQLAQDYVSRYAKKRKKSWRADELILLGKIIPKWGDVKAKEITRRDVVHLLDRIAERTPTHANRILAVLRKMYNWAIERGELDASPCDRVKRPGIEKRRDRVLTHDEIRAFWNGVRKTDMPAPTQAALKLQLVTGQRIGEIIGATRSEFDWKNSDWLIPAKRTKNGHEHLVPLSPLAVELIEGLEGAGETLFPTRGKSKASVLRVDVVTHQLAAAIKQLDMEHFTSHDLRRTAATGLTSLKTLRVVMDAILNHKDRTTGAVYDRHHYYDEKRAALEAWATKISDIVSSMAAVI
jgi:integrase